ncbi:hypothetical protein R9X47_10900 [Wukongibacter baidiensis]|uniref:hypothetical protein n=1 Tax=Wukongibacter baidiensis TaxID=1723361 RepID=UPI003D7F72E8
MILTWTDEFSKRLESTILKIKVKNEEIRLTISVDYDTYNYVYENEMFNLYREVIGKNFKDNFDKEKVLEIELKLDPKLVSILDDAVDLNEEAIKKYLLEKSEEKPDNLFINTSSWYVLNVKQEEELPEHLKAMGSVKVGFDTKWNEEL